MLIYASNFITTHSYVLLAQIQKLKKILRKFFEVCGGSGGTGPLGPGPKPTTDLAGGAGAEPPRYGPKPTTISFLGFFGCIYKGLSSLMFKELIEDYIVFTAARVSSLLFSPSRSL